MKFKDYFSAQSDIYAKYRPTYPDELFQFLASLINTHDLAWDFATGNGQAAVSLAGYFKNVIATDASEPQIKNAIPHERVRYSVALADDSGIESGTVDLVTIASALHWMSARAGSDGDFDKFYNEVNRVLKPGGIFAAWAYCDNHISDTVDPIVKHFSRVTLANYWPPERNYVFNYYRNIPFPPSGNWSVIETPGFKASVKATMDFLFGNLHSWSSTQQYIKKTGHDPVDLVRKKLEDAWGDANEPKEITWELMLKVGRKTI